MLIRFEFHKGTEPLLAQNLTDLDGQLAQRRGQEMALKRLNLAENRGSVKRGESGSC